MQERRKWHFTYFNIPAYVFNYFLVTILQLFEILMKIDNDDTEKRQGLCAKSHNLSCKKGVSHLLVPALGTRYRIEKGKVATGML